MGNIETTIAFTNKLRSNHNRQNFAPIQSEEILLPGSNILFVSDFADENWNLNHGRKPLISGIKTFSEQMTMMLREKGYEVNFIHPFITDESDRRIFLTKPIPFYKTVEVLFNNPAYVHRKIKELLKRRPDGVFIATVEGILGVSTMLACRRLGISYTLASTTNFAEYFSTYITQSTHNFFKPNIDMLQVLSSLLYKGADHILVPTPTMQRIYKKQGFPDTVVWPRGVDSAMFRPAREGEKNPYEQFN